MKVISKTFGGEKYYLIYEYEFKFGVVYTFFNLNNNTVYCFKENNDYIQITNKRILKKINNFFKICEIKDVI